MTAVDDPRNDALLITLELAVPLRMHQLATMDPAHRERTRARWAAAAAVEVGTGGDQLIFDSVGTRARRHGSCAHCTADISAEGGRWYSIDNDGRQFTCRTSGPHSLAQPGQVGPSTRFNALAQGIAAAAFQPGGVDFLGGHWCMGHCTREAAA